MRLCDEMREKRIGNCGKAGNFSAQESKAAISVNPHKSTTSPAEGCTEGAAGVMRVAKEDTRTNPADALTKIQRFDRKQKLLWPLGHLLISKAHQGTDGSGDVSE
jgi:hypothetical protein